MRALRKTETKKINVSKVSRGGGWGGGVGREKRKRERGKQKNPRLALS